MKMLLALWTREAVRQLAPRRYAVSLAVRGVVEYLRRWRFTPQTPIKRTREQQPEAVRERLEFEHPVTAVADTDVRGRSYSYAGGAGSLGMARIVLNDLVRDQPGKVPLDDKRR